MSCQNELYIAHDQRDMVVNLGWRRYFMHMLSLPMPERAEDDPKKRPVDASSA